MLFFYSQWGLSEIANLILVHKNETFIRDVLYSEKYKRVIKEDGMTIRLYRARGDDHKCVFHNKRAGCVLDIECRPLICRMWWCGLVDKSHRMIDMDDKLYREYRMIKDRVTKMRDELSLFLYYKGIRLDNAQTLITSIKQVEEGFIEHYSRFMQSGTSRKKRKRVYIK